MPLTGAGAGVGVGVADIAVETDITKRQVTADEKNHNMVLFGKKRRVGRTFFGLSKFAGIVIVERIR